MKMDTPGLSMLEKSLNFWGFQTAPSSITHPEKEEKWDARQETAGVRARNKEAAKQGRVSPFGTSP
jgi:hypothetical protein